MWFRRKPFARRGEDLAARALRRAGYRILDRNVRMGRVEIDIIAREKDTVAFVEVKSRRTGDPIPPEDNVGKTKRRHIRTAARMYLSREQTEDTYYRFDVVSVVMPEGAKPTITIYRDAFGEDLRSHGEG